MVTFLRRQEDHGHADCHLGHALRRGAPGKFVVHLARPHVPPGPTPPLPAWIQSRSSSSDRRSRIKFLSLADFRVYSTCCARSRRELRSSKPCRVGACPVELLCTVPTVSRMQFKVSRTLARSTYRMRDCLRATRQWCDRRKMSASRLWSGRRGRPRVTRSYRPSRGG